MKIVTDKSNANYSVGNEVIYGTEVLKSNLCDYSGAYILARADITIIGRNLATGVAFKNCAAFIKCMTKIDETTIKDAADLDLVMLMCNLLEYSCNYSDTAGSLWFYSKDEAANFNANVVGNNNFNDNRKYSCRWSKCNFRKCNNCSAVKLSKKFLEIT